MNVLNDDWVAIRDFSKDLYDGPNNEFSNVDTIQVLWDKDTKTVVIAFTSTLSKNKTDEHIKHETSLHIDAISAIDLQLRDVIPTLDVPLLKLPSMDYTGK